MRSTVRPLRRTLLRLLPIATLAAAGIAFSAPASAADELVVSAAASLTNAFKAVGDAYEKQHPETKVLFNFGASDVLMQQIAKARRPTCSRRPTRRRWIARRTKR